VAGSARTTQLNRTLAMIRASLRDLAWRRRRFVITVLGTALVFSVTLLIGALRNGLPSEVDRTLGALGADHFVVSDQTPGPFSGFVPINEDATQLFESKGRTGAVIVLRQPLPGAKPGDVRDANVFAYRLGGLGAPPTTKGRSVAAAGEAVVDGRLGRKLGDTIAIGPKRFRVVGITHGLTLGAGSPNVYVSIEDVQSAVFGGSKVATMLIVDGDVGPMPPGLIAQTRDEARRQLLRPLHNSQASLQLMAVLLWIVAAAIVGAGLYLSAIERTKDFAVFKATGARTGDIAAGLAVQAATLTVAASVAAVVLAMVLAPLFPLPVTIPVSQAVQTLLVAVVVGLVASIAGLRHAASVGPALAFGAQ
jgi:putative ABC transport system permease protein